MMLTSLTRKFTTAFLAEDVIEKTVTDLQEYVTKRICERDPSLEGKCFKIVDEETKE